MDVKRKIQSIYYTLTQAPPGFMSVKALGMSVGLNPRALRQTKNGRLLDAARAVIFRQTGKILVTRTGNPSGVCLTDDSELVKACAKELHSHAMGELRTAARLERMLVLKAAGQHELFEDANDQDHA